MASSEVALGNGGECGNHLMAKAFRHRLCGIGRLLVAAETNTPVSLEGDGDVIQYGLEVAYLAGEHGDLRDLWGSTCSVGSATAVAGVGRAVRGWTAGSGLARAMTKATGSDGRSLGMRKVTRMGIGGCWIGCVMGMLLRVTS